MICYVVCLLWQFDAPVVSAWQLGLGQVQDVDLFSGSQPDAGPGEEPLPSSPALYVGMHQKQVRVKLKLHILTKQNNKIFHSESTKDVSRFSIFASLV